jgi:CheY-like chemotaxis protein
MSDAGSPLKALSVETKALMIVSEFEARRMPMFQMRAVFQAVVRDDEERKRIVDLVEKDLRASGYPEAQVASFLSDLISSDAGPVSGDISITSTRRLRSPFAREFDQGLPPPPDAPKPAAAGFLTPAPIPAAPINPRGSGAGIPALPPRRPTMGPGGMTLAEATPPRGSPKIGSGSRHPAQQPVAEPLQPVGQKTVFRHDLAFGKVMPSMVSPPDPGAQVPQAPPPAIEANVPPAPAAFGSKPVVLLADDDKRIRMVFRLRLEAAGYSVVEVGDGEEAFKRLEQGGISLAVLDMKMPGLHGLEILSRMVDRQIRIPVIVCSAYDQLENEFVVQTHQNLKYLVKPVAPDSLIAAARELLKKI